MAKTAFYVFKGQSMCFPHVLLNALDLLEKGHEVKIIMEGEATKLIKELEEAKNKLYLKVKEIGLFDCICKAYSAKMGVLEYNQTVGIPLSDEMSGHPPMSKYIEQGYSIIVM